MSPRAAWRLETLGFARIYDYVAGKADWAAAGLPLEGTAAGRPTAGAVADPDVPTCALDDDLGEVRARMRRAAWETCIVVNAERIVLGRLGRTALAEDGPGTVETAMTTGPSTVRPSKPLADLIAQMDRSGWSTALVTTSEGMLVGLVRRDATER